ncbi:ABC transporter permease [Hoeflea sp.]|uniref:ABC transporter permease n=1 Tax=Hoeflea sp. TaxID=1940281 RepID=UPI003A8F3E66
MSTVDATELKPFKPALAMPRSLPAVLTAIVLLVMWEGCIHIFSVPAYILPTPSAVAARFYQDLSSGLIIPHFWLTLLEVVLGFLIATVVGIGLGTAVGLIPAFDRTIYPILLAFQTVPKVAIAPLLIIWFGYGMHSKAIMAALIAFFPILVNVIAGLKTTDARRVLLMKALRASPLQIYMKVRLPSMLPYLFAGLEVGIVFSLIGAIVGEFVGASVGLGSLIIQRQAVVDVAGVFSVLVYLSLMGLVMSLAVKLVADRMTFWSRSQDIASA